MRRVTEEEMAFYDRVAERITVLLGQPQCPLNQSTLAERVGWNRASLCNFVNRIDKSIAAHFVPRIARALQVPVEQLMEGSPASTAERTSWDPRWDEPQIIVDKIAEWKQRKLPWMTLRRTLPAWLMPSRAMLVNYVDSIFGGANPVAAERWHELAETRQKCLMNDADGEADGLHLMFMRDLMRIPHRKPPYHGFSTEEIVQLLEHLKKEWVLRRNFRLIAADDSARTAEVRLELAGNRSLTALGREVRIEYRDDTRVHWSEAPNAVALTRECLSRVKKSAGLGARDNPTPQQVVQVIDDLLCHVDLHEQTHRADNSPPSSEPAVQSSRRTASFRAFSPGRDMRMTRRAHRLALPTF